MSRSHLIVLCSLLAAALGLWGHLSIEQYGLDNLVSLVSIWGVAAIIFLESGVPVGFFFPGDSLLFTVGFLVYQEVVAFDIHTAAALFFAAAVLGDSTGYVIGRRGGRGLFRTGRFALNPPNLARAERFFVRYGGAAIILARFVPVVRTFTPIAAGTSRMHYPRFLAFNITGAAIWALGATYLGYCAGSWIEATGLSIEYAILLVIFITFLPPVIHVLRNKKNRVAIHDGAGQLVRAFFDGGKK